MTTTTIDVFRPAPGRPTVWRRAAWSASDTLTLARRNLIVWLRVPAFLVFTVVQPVMFTLLFRYVFSGVIHVQHLKGGYVSFLMPGIIGQTAAFGSMGTAIALAREAQKGIIDRFRSMPIARSAVLTGRLLSDTMRITFTLAVLIGVGYAVGFRFQNGAGSALIMMAMSVLFGLTVCCVSAFIGLAIRDEESVQAFAVIWIFPLTFISSAFVPVRTMPGWLQAFAINQPVTIWIDMLRSLAIGGPLYTHVWESLVWMGGVLLVFAPLAVRAYRRPG
jgi:ABC-2 type transport system permease protein/oleandomycin transport system permease protein